MYDRISPPYKKFLEGLTATYAQPKFEDIARDKNFELHPGPRGAPENVGNILKAVHPVIRTNPVTGWKSVFAVGSHVQKVNGVSKEESAHLLKWFVDLIVENHDLQVRFRWQNPNDLGKYTPTHTNTYVLEFDTEDLPWFLAIWDNRSVYHAATWDIEGQGPRAGHRVVSLGERPYFDPASTGRREALFGSE